ncbi:MAG: chromosome segregation protein SMC [Kiritimatiellae bacterium]|nr:chromosome segregation protein SMC [Kiritimatiellia bacterium]
MYLKELDIIGFKSFADKTRLDFDPGLIAIVGPNGCGKSNVSDAIRWVLGEQRPTALRCSKLADVVFNGTDTRKPLGLAEVSITFADCEKELGTDYHEVTITRRVYRDGTGEYFINKQPSRLKDVQHLFMGTGIGTSSYSVMAQGQIDAILSSKPEDRRAVFEEASGITKFKADRKEALRKIDQTEQNLLREADILKEMRRQIASLQRQVGKAQKYKELRDELRGLDIYVSKQRIHQHDLELEENANNRREIEEAIREAQEVVAAAEQEAQNLHAEIHALEERLQDLASREAAAEGEYRRANEVIGVNRARIEEYKSFAERDSYEIRETRRQLEEVAMQSESLEQKKKLLTDSLEAAKLSMESVEEEFRSLQTSIDEKREAVARRRREVADTTRSGTLVNDSEVNRNGAVEVWKSGTSVTTMMKREDLMILVTEAENELREAEMQHLPVSQRLTECRIAASQLEQELSFVGQQTESAVRRREELERQVSMREEGVQRYEDSIARLTEESGDLFDQLDELKDKAAQVHAMMDAERAKRGAMMERISIADAQVAVKRGGLDQARDFRAKLEVQAAESTMRRQNVFAHLEDEYGLFADAVMREADPEWKGGVVPPLKELEGKVAKIQADIAALGPVNMVAIDECRELEERYAREKAQEEDLIAAKAQILELINNLNMTSSDLFKKTFEQANKNFQAMFTKLFGGGEARLVLLENEEDPLECGIDIIARPPGKRPQSVTLLSGGERTMTAVALLFSIFMIKPAPFCMLDELDAALDDANIGRFVEQLKEFLIKSQFLIITHNQHTIAGSDLVYGVSQQEKGVSRVISMKLSDLGVKSTK